LDRDRAAVSDVDLGDRWTNEDGRFVDDCLADGCRDTAAGVATDGHCASAASADHGHRQQIVYELVHRLHDIGVPANTETKSGVSTTW
jgi:hypothetical protein